MIEIIRLNKSYKQDQGRLHVLKEISLTIEQGEFLAIKGTSGAGKTTLLNVIGCIDTFDSGMYLLNGTDVGRLNDYKLAAVRNQEIGFVLQDFALLNQESTLLNTMLPLYFNKTPRRQMKALAMEALESVGIGDQAHKKAIHLSGGQRQRVAIARAIVNKPSIILADEPTGALDTKTSAQIMSLLRELNGQGITVIVVTHDENVAGYCKRLIEISDGVYPR